MKRSTDQLLFVLFFYLVLIVTVLVSPLVLFWTSDETVQIIFTYTFIIAISLLFIKLLQLKIPVSGFLPGSIAAIVSMCLLFAILLVSGVVSGISLQENFMIYLIPGRGHAAFRRLRRRAIIPCDDLRRLEQQYQLLARSDHIGVRLRAACTSPRCSSSASGR